MNNFIIQVIPSLPFVGTETNEGVVAGALLATEMVVEAEAQDAALVQSKGDQISVTNWNPDLDQGLPLSEEGQGQNQDQGQGHGRGQVHLVVKEVWLWKCHLWLEVGQGQVHLVDKGG